MFPEVIGPLIIMQIRQVELLKQGRPLMLKQIELESAPGYELKPAEASFVVPDAFAAAYKKVFPGIFTRVQQTLNNKARVEEVLIAIFKQFIERWGVQLERLEDYHVEDLDVMCDAAVAEDNRHSHTGLVMLGPGVDGDFRRTKLPEEILHSVEQELRLRPGRADETFAHAGVA
jgi:PHP family Zn ribbon phosphoesterase